MGESEASKYKQEMRRFCATHMSEKSKAADKEHRIPTVICLKATDHALQAGARLSLAHFIREHPVKRLAKTEVRYYLEKGQVDPVVSSLQCSPYGRFLPLG